MNPTPTPTLQAYSYSSLIILISIGGGALILSGGRQIESVRDLTYLSFATEAADPVSKWTGYVSTAAGRIIGMGYWSGQAEKIGEVLGVITDWVRTDHVG